MDRRRDLIDPGVLGWLAISLALGVMTAALLGSAVWVVPFVLLGGAMSWRERTQDRRGDDVRWLILAGSCALGIALGVVTGSALAVAPFVLLGLVGVAYHHHREQLASR